jgi:GAF domain-containing protein
MHDQHAGWRPSKGGNLASADPTPGRETLFAPPDRRRLVLGILVAILGCLAVTPIALHSPLEQLSSVLYLLVVVLATIVGRLIAGGVAVALSAILIDYYLFPRNKGLSPGAPAELVAVFAFSATAFIIAQLLARKDDSARAALHERERMAFLIRAGDALSSSLDYEIALSELARLVVPTLADWCSVDLMDTPDHIENLVVAHIDPKKVELAREMQRRFPPDPKANTGVANVVRTGKPELFPEITDEMLRTAVADEEQLRIARDLGLVSAMTVPLTARGRTFGSITLVSAESKLHYAARDLELAQEVAGRAALAIDNARLFRAEAQAREQMEIEAARTAALQAVTGALGPASTEEEIADATVNQGITASGARAGGIGLLRPSGDIEMIRVGGYQPDDRPYWRSFHVADPFPLSEAVREKKVVILRTTRERDERFPSLAGAGEMVDHAIVCLPLEIGDRTIGGMVASFPPETEFDDARLSFLTALGEQCSQALDRAASYERERMSRARLDDLAEISRALASSLELGQVTSLVVRLAARYLGERVALFAADEGPSIGSLASARRGPDAGAVLDPTIAEEALRRPSISELIARAIDTREMVVIDPDGVIPGDDVDDPTGSMPPLVPGVVLPLQIAGRFVGALMVADPGRIAPLSADDRSYAQEVARRMARAIENSRAYRERDHVARTLQQSLLPPALPEVPGLEIRSVFQPALDAYEIGGDFYDVFETADGRWAAVIGDVCGKGIEAAALTSLARHTLRGASRAHRPSRALRVLNEALLREKLDGKFCTACYLVLDPRPDGVAVTLSVAGHPLPQLVKADGSVESIGSHGTMLGVIEDPKLTDVGTLLLPGQTLVLFTDGLLGKDDRYLEERDALAALLDGGGSGDVSERLSERVTGFGADRRDDDVAVLILKATGPER